jgi:transcriptional regulator with XRE-family HTH domain
MGKIQKAIADKIAERNKIGKLGQREMARALGCSQATVSYLLTGARGLSEKWIERFCDYLGITLGDLEKPTPPPPTEPKKLRDYMDKLKRLYEISSVPAFKNVSRSIDDWLEACEAVSAAKSQITELNVVEGAFGKPPEVKEAPAIDYSDPKHKAPA